MHDHVNVSVCRFCLCKPEPEGYRIIFVEHLQTPVSTSLTIIREVIEKIMKIKVDNHSTKSRIMCSACEGKLFSFQSFYDQVRTNEEIWEKCRIQAARESGSPIIEELDTDSMFLIKEEPDDEDTEIPFESFMEQGLVVEVKDVIKTTKKESKLKATTESPRKRGRKSILKTTSRKSTSKALKALKEEDDTEKKRRTVQFDPEEDKLIRDFFDMTCQTCKTGEQFETFADFRRHMREEHNDKNGFILCCNVRLQKRHSLVEHMAYHSQSESLKCPICGKLYTKRDILQYHIKQMHGSETDRPYQCDLCGKRYVRLQTLEIHMRVHLSKEAKALRRVHKCEECDAKFSTIHNMRNHVKYKHRGIYSYFCTGCAKYYKTKLDYEIHRRNVHDDDGPMRMQCHICSRWFSHEKALRVHIRDTHNPDTPFHCTICKHQTKSRQALRSHIKMKHEERKFRCEYCEKAFQTLRRLNEHITVHVGGTLYSCAFCEKTFNSNSNMYKHLKAMHPQEWLQEKMMKATNPKYQGVGMGSMTLQKGLDTSLILGHAGNQVIGSNMK